jgi:subtilisin family serine protease
MLLSSIAAGAAAQILPSLPTGALPNTALPPGAAPTVQGVLDDVRGDLGRLRVQRIDTLLRAHPRELERDAAGDAVVRGEILAIAPTAAVLGEAEQAGFSARRRTSLPDLGIEIVVLAPPRNMSATAAIRRLRRAAPEGAFEYNHVYAPAESSAPAGAAPPAAGGRSAAGVRIGMIDTGVAAAGLTLVQQVFAPGRLHPAEHGAAVALLMAGPRGVAPGARLFVADIYGDGPVGGSAEQVAEALAWLAGQRLAVINMSVVGPPNALLRAAIGAATARGSLIVAAVGNDGPAAPPLYPAAYPDVVGVTGVDARRRPLIEAARGPQVDFAALGVVDAASGAGRPARGTSFAAPIVAARLALLLREPDSSGAARAVEALAASAIDLGARGRDDTFGRGLVPSR